MRVLLDTHTLLWMDAEQDKLSPTIKSVLLDPSNEIIVSVVSIWEIIIKQSLGKLTTRQPLYQIIEEQQRVNAIVILPVRLDHVWKVDGLPDKHKDPFDRLLIAQAITDDLTFATADTAINEYPVRTIW